MSKIKELLQAPLTLSQNEKTELFKNVYEDETSHEALKNPKAFTMFVSYFLNKYKTILVISTVFSLFPTTILQKIYIVLFFKLLRSSNAPKNHGQFFHQYVQNVRAVQW